MGPTVNFQSAASVQGLAMLKAAYGDVIDYAIELDKAEPFLKDLLEYPFITSDDGFNP